jgi:hypothetical protein
MLTIPQIEALRKTNPQLPEMLKRLRLRGLPRLTDARNGDVHAEVAENNDR